MSDLPSPDPERDRIPPNGNPPRSSLGFDELIALAIAFASMGAILFWALGQPSGSGLLTSLPSLIRPSTSASPSLVPSPSDRLTPSPGSGLLDPSLSAQPNLPTNLPTNVPTIIQPNVQPNVRPNAQRPNVQPIPIPFAAPAPQPSIAASPSPSPSPRTEFPDVPPNFWATPFITELARRGIVTGFLDTTYRPDQPVTRAEFASMLQAAFPTAAPPQSASPQPVSFTDVPADYWGTEEIDQAVQSGFMRGYPENQFRPEQQIPKEQAIVALNTGLQLPIPASPTQVVSVYQDADQITPYAVGAIAAATQSNLVVNYPEPSFLKPQLTTSRAEAAALIYQALVQRQQASPIESAYIVQAPR
ncbi:MAG: S-layer homology domain-containing protein [Oculatellaceae cyanobacterium Prado106]|jgi:hypothetical protein|nr:S-layer homology domain-containing protein [Oculatellaceae cyanobacterium Prado106]